MAWSTRAAAIAALREQLQDTAAPQRYTDSELGIGVDQAVDELSRVRPIMVTVTATAPADRIVRVDDLLTAVVFKSVVSVVNTTPDQDVVVEGWYYFEAASQHKIIVPSSVAVGDILSIQVRGGYGFSLAFVSGAISGTLDTNIPAEWRERLLQGAEGYVLDLYGAREVGRTNVAPAVAQQTARAAANKLRAFEAWLASLPHINAGRQFVSWGLAAVDARTSDHRGFD